MQAPATKPSGYIRFCWICGRAVPLENCKTEEHGSVVHEECYAARLKLQAVASSHRPRAQRQL